MALPLQAFAAPPYRTALYGRTVPQVIFVYGMLTWRGDLLIARPRASPRRAWLYLLVGAMSVEGDGVILFQVSGGGGSSPACWSVQQACKGRPPQFTALTITCRC